MTKKRVSASLSADLIAAVDEFCDEYSLSRSRVLDDLLRKAIDEDEEIQEQIEDAVSDPVLKLARKKAKEEEIRAKQELREKRISFKDRCLGYFRKRLEGDAGYDIEGMEELAEGYLEEYELWEDDPERLRAMEDRVNRWMEWYRMGYWAREHAHTVESEIKTDDVEWWFHVGRDIYRLRRHIDDVIEVVEAVAVRENGYQSSAVVEAVASKFSVCEGAVMLLLEHMVEPDSSASIQDALNLNQLSGDNLEIAGSLEAGPDYVDDVEALPEDATIRQGGEELAYSEINSEVESDD